MSEENEGASSRMPPTVPRRSGERWTTAASRSATIPAAFTGSGFAAYARAFAVYGELVKPPSSSRPRPSGRFSAGRPALLELRLAAEAITPSTTLSAIRDEALKQTPRQRRGSPH